MEYHVVDEFRRGGDQLDLPAHMSLIAEQVRTQYQLRKYHIRSVLSQRREPVNLSVYASAQHIDRDSYYGAATLKDDLGIDLPQPSFDNSAYGGTEDLAVSTGVQFFSHSDRFLFAPADFTLGIRKCIQ